MDDSLEILNGKKLADNSNYVSATFRYVFSQIFRDFHRFAGTFRDFQRLSEIKLLLKILLSCRFDIQKVVILERERRPEKKPVA